MNSITKILNDGPKTLCHGELWTNGIKRIAQKNFHQVTTDRSRWKELEEAYMGQKSYKCSSSKSLVFSHTKIENFRANKCCYVFSGPSQRHHNMAIVGNTN